MAQIVNKKVNLTLVGLDGNVFSLVAAFRKQARREGWTPEEIKAVTEEAMYSDYNHALAVLMAHCVHDGMGPDDDDDDDDFEEDEDEEDIGEDDDE